MKESFMILHLVQNPIIFLERKKGPRGGLVENRKMKRKVTKKADELCDF
jgi:hypothetical protein